MSISIRQLLASTAIILVSAGAAYAEGNTVNNFGITGTGLPEEFIQYGQNNTLYITQLGENNKVHGNQSGNGSSAEIRQEGDQNIATIFTEYASADDKNQAFHKIKQIGNGNEALLGASRSPLQSSQTVIQTGDNNIAKNAQYGNAGLVAPENTTISITQTGDSNSSLSFQGSDGSSYNSINIEQTGNNNTSRANQYGATQVSYLSQKGDSNISENIQSGSGSYSELSQLGNNNTGSVFQAGENNFMRVAQQGDLNVMVGSQYSINNTIDAGQVGNTNKMVITQQ